jgi:hypothetical protein
MFEPKAILRFAAILAATFALLMWPWPAWHRAYASYIRGVGDAAFSQFWFWPAGSVRFVDLRSPGVFEKMDALVPVQLPEEYRTNDKFRPEGERDILLLLQNRNTPGSFGILRTSSRGIAYWPTAALIALVLATPVVWRRKAWIFVWAVIGIHLFILVRLSVYVAANGFFDRTKKYCLYECGDFVFGMFRRFEIVLCDNPTVSFVVPVFIWLIVLFGMLLWSTWRERIASSTTPRGARRARRMER